MTPTILGVGWLALKTAIFLGGSLGIVKGVQIHHDYSFRKGEKETDSENRPPKRRRRDVYTGEDASKELGRMRELQETK